MSLTCTIGELAKSAGVAVSTVRFYEREGLVVPDGRTESRYRVYGHRSLQRLRFIRAALASGLSLADVKALLALRDRDEAPCGEVRGVLERRLREIEQGLADMRRVRASLRSSLAACRDEPAVAPCRVVRGLEAAAAGGAARRHARRAKDS